jgi:hypothetical protein
MHIEITYCQGTIPTSENEAAQEKRTAEKAAMANVLPNGPG